MVDNDNNDSYKTTKIPKIRWCGGIIRSWISVAAALMFLITFFPSCALRGVEEDKIGVEYYEGEEEVIEDGEYGVEEDDETGLQEGLGASATVTEIADNPEEYYGETVTVSGEVEEIRGVRTFIIGETDDVPLEDELLVITAKAPPVPGPSENIYSLEGNVVQVTGIIRRFDADQIEGEIGWDLAPDIEADFDDRPVLVASSITVTPRGLE